MSMPFKEAILMAERQLADAGCDNPKGDAKTLYCYLQGYTEAQLLLKYQDVLDDKLCDSYFALVERRVAREPLQHIVGTVNFMGNTLKVTPDVLIPRPETEVVTSLAISMLRSGEDVLDLCCGSGAIGISIAKEVPRASVTLADISDAALAIAKENAKSNGVNVKLVKSDMFEAFKGRLGNKKFDLIISNPPYIRSTLISDLQPEVRDHDPRLALDGGPDGLDFYRIIAGEAADHLKKGGRLVLEIGSDQALSVGALLKSADKFATIGVAKDLAGLERIIVTTLVSERK